MDERIARTIRNIQTLADLAQFEKNAEKRQALTDEMREAVRVRSTELGRTLVAERTGLDLSDLSPSEEKIVLAASEYAGVKKRSGSDAGRTFSQLRNRGLLGAAEASVIHSKPTQGFQGLSEADLADLSYEQIIVDHPEEFSARAQWYARRTLGLPNESDKPPAKGASLTQERTEALLGWLEARSAADGGHLRSFTNAEAAAAIGITDLHRSGRVFGNIQSRVDFACHRLGLPPLGLAADTPFDVAWAQQDRSWAFPIAEMQAAARSRIWSAKDFELVLAETEQLPGQAHMSWQKELSVNEGKVQAWASGIGSLGPSAPAPGEREATTRRNPTWSRNELILALDLYLRFRDAPPSKDSVEVTELSSFLATMDRAKGVGEAQTFRNANGVYMKLMNFRRFDPEYTADGKVGLVRGNKLEESVWNEFAGNPQGLAKAIAEIRAGVRSAGPKQEDRDDITEPAGEAPYWVFVCNPKKWAIDRFFDLNIEHDEWGVRPSDRHKFAPGQLGVVRVGLDRRSKLQRGAKPPLEPGIYALCEVESEAFPGTGANDEFWVDGEGREPGWPTVKIRYLRTYRDRPLTIERLNAERPNISRLLLDGFQAASFPITASDFHTVLELLGEDVDDLALPREGDTSPETLTALQSIGIRPSARQASILAKIASTPNGRWSGGMCLPCSGSCGNLGTRCFAGFSGQPNAVLLASCGTIGTSGRINKRSPATTPIARSIRRIASCWQFRLRKRTNWTRLRTNSCAFVSMNKCAARNARPAAH